MFQLADGQLKCVGMALTAGLARRWRFPQGAFRVLRTQAARRSLAGGRQPLRIYLMPAMLMMVPATNAKWDAQCYHR